MLIAILLITGLCAGSFINALVWRIHEQAKKTKKSGNLSILKGRSMCPNCRHELAAKDLIPVISWLWLRGKCRYCGKPISAQYPVVELLTAGLFIFSYVFWPFMFDAKGTILFIFWLVFLIGLIALAIYDIKWQLLPNRIIFPLIYIAILQSMVLIIFTPSFHQFLSILLSTVIGGGLFYLLFQLSNGKWIGGGDVKLGALLGLILANASLIIMTIFAASLIGTAISVPLMIIGRFNRKTRIAFGPLLIVGAIIAQLFGHSFINWYKHKFLYY